MKSKLLAALTPLPKFESLSGTGIGAALATAACRTVWPWGNVRIADIRIVEATRVTSEKACLVWEENMAHQQKFLWEGMGLRCKVGLRRDRSREDI